LEGTGSIIFDQDNKIAYGSVSVRLDEDLFREFCAKIGFKPVVFHSYQTIDQKRMPIYHTNVMMCLADKFAVICLDCIDDETERKQVVETIEKSGKEIIAITEEQMHNFAGNMLQLHNDKGDKFLIMSQTAYSSLTQEQIKNIEKYKTDNNIEEILWLTHHDLAMNGAYPNSIPLKEILGVDRVINGHIHGTKESVIIKNTVYYNKGNIARNKIDLINHRPAVWVYFPFDSEEEPSINGIKCKALIPYYLNVQEGKDVFRLTGKHAGKNSLTEEDIKDLIEPKEKVFASLLHQQEDEVNKTEDATVVEESLAEFLETEKPRKEVCDLIFNLLKRTQEKTIE